MDDDARRRTVALVSDTPEHILDRAHVAAAASRDERAGGPGQLELTDAEKKRLEPFSGNNSYRKAAAVKAVMRDAGVDDWTAHYDETLTVDEHRDVAERAAREGGGRRLDAEDGADARLGRAEAAMGEECNHARGHCEHGDPDACEFLTDACGYDEEEVASILSDDDANGEREITGKAAGALGRAWQGYKAGIARLERELDDALEAKRHAERAAAGINAIRADHGQEPIELERLEELSDRLAAAGSGAHDAEGHVEGDAFVDDRDAGQEQLDVDADTRQSQGRESRPEAERASAFGVDDRSDPSRGAGNDGPETEQREFPDPEQESL